MRYITYKRYKGRAICGDVNIPAKTVCECENNIITYNGEPICVNTSYVAHSFFFRDDDGNGILRGELVKKIMKRLDVSNKKHDEHWERVWKNMLCSTYKRVDHEDYWLWNHEFYNASISDLQYILKLVSD